MVAPNAGLVDVGCRDPQLQCELAARSVVVQISQSSKVLGRDAGGLCLQDQAVCICWVGDNKHLNVLASKPAKHLDERCFFF